VDSDGYFLPYSFIFVKNYPEFNWTSNTSGEFELNFPEVLKSDTLVDTLLGYQKVQVPLSKLNPTGNRIKLEEVLIGQKNLLLLSQKWPQAPFRSRKDTQQ